MPEPGGVTSDGTMDPVAAELTAIRERSEHMRSRYGHVGGLLALAGAKDDVPRLLAAVEAVLAFHQPKTVTVRRFCGPHASLARIAEVTGAEIVACPDCSDNEVVTCTGCDPVCPDDNFWPCATVRAITTELLGEGEADVR